MIDYYYEFPEGTRLFNEPVRYAFQRGFHPDSPPGTEHVIHSECYAHASRMWVENANGLTMIRENGRDVHKKCNPKVMTWLKLQAREL